MSGSRSQHHAILWLVCVAAVAALHIPYLQLPYYWDEAGYYVPAALDLAQHGRLIPQSTAANPHPPLLSLYLAAAYKLFGAAPLVTRLAMCIVSGTAVYALLVLAMVVTPATGGLWAAGLLALSPIFFAQSSLAHLDTAATAATLLALYFFLRGRTGAYLAAATILCLTRETGAALVLVLAIYRRRPLLLLPLLPLAAWFATLRLDTGHWLGDPGFVNYNLWEALNPARFVVTLLRRVHFLSLVDFRWLLAVPLVFFLRKDRAQQPVLWLALATQIVVMSLFGGAILNRYLLPALALFFLLAVRCAYSLRSPASSLLPAATLLAGIACWFWNPPYPFPYEENLAYADFVSLHEAGAERLSRFPPGTRILTAWPATDEFRRPELGYTKSPARVVAMEDFSEEAFETIKPEDFDVLFLYSREWRPEWNLLEEWPVLHQLRVKLYGRRRQASTAWIRERYKLISLGAIEFRGQWIHWLQRRDVRLLPVRPEAVGFRQPTAPMRLTGCVILNVGEPPAPQNYISGTAMLRKANLLFTAILFLTSIEFAQNWPQFRGPGGTGIGDESRPPPVQFSPGQKMLWKTAVPVGHSSPSIWGNRVFLTAFEAEGHKLLVLALDRRSGRTVWTHQVPAERIEKVHAVSNPATATPVTDGQQVYVYFGSAGLFALDLEGRPIWSVPLPPSQVAYGSGTSPILAGERVVLSRDEGKEPYLLAVDRKTGKTVWKQAQGTEKRPWGSGRSTPVLWNDEVIVHRGADLVGFDLQTGVRKWWVGFWSQGNGTPVIGGDTVYVATWTNFGEPDLRVPFPKFESIIKTVDKDGDGLISESEYPGDLLLSHRVEMEGIPGASMYLGKNMKWMDANKDGKIDQAEWDGSFSSWEKSIVDHAVIAVRLGGAGDVTASHVLWRESRNVPEIPAPLFYKDRVFTVTNGGVLTCLEAKSGKVLFRGRLGAGGGYFSSPVASSNRVFLASGAGVISVVDALASELTVLARNEIGEEIFATPAIVDGKVYVRTTKHLYAFGN